MKKLMIAAAAAAMTGAVFAEGAVYEMALTVKSTAAKNGTVKDACNCIVGSVYRKQASFKVAGLFWGCDCYLPNAVLVDRDPFTAEFGSGEGNYIFWNATDKTVWADEGGYLDQVFEWKLLGKMGQKANECEGAWTLQIGNLDLQGAGFGKISGCEENTIVKSISGNFAGFWDPGQGCKRCADNASSFWPLCECGEEENATAAYGTWNLKYNSSLSKKFARGDAAWYKFPADVLAAIAQFVDPVDPDDPTAEKVAIYKKAKADWEAAKEVTKAAILVTEEKTNALRDWLTISGQPTQTYRNFNGFNISVAATGTTKAEDDGLDLLNALIANGRNEAATVADSTFVTDMTAINGGLTVDATAYLTAKFALRNAQANLRVAQKAKELNQAINWTAAAVIAAPGTVIATEWKAYYPSINGAAAPNRYENHNGTQQDVDAMTLAIKHAATDIDPVSKKPYGAEVDLAKDITEALDVLKGNINTLTDAGTITAAQKTEALSLIADCDTDFAAVEAALIAQETAALERIAATANLTTAQITAKTAELLQAVKDADEAQGLADEDETIKREKMAAAKANCGAACD